MEHPSVRPSMERSVAALLGPAVASRGGAAPAPSLGALAEPLAPFVRPGWQPVAAPAQRKAPVQEELETVQVLPEELPAPGGEPESWEHAPAEEDSFADDDLGLVRGADWGLAAGTDDFYPEGPDPLADALLDLSGGASHGDDLPELEPSGPEAAAPDEASVEASVEALQDAMVAVGAAAALERVPGAEVSPEHVQPVEARSERLEQSAHAETVTGREEVPALQEVAGRLERIARALREGRPIELFSSGSSDPLEVLIAGYALGYSEAFRRANEERRTGQ